MINSREKFETPWPELSCCQVSKEGGRGRKQEEKKPWIVFRCIRRYKVNREDRAFRGGFPWNQTDDRWRNIHKPVLGGRGGGEDALSTRDVTRERKKTRGGRGKGNFSPSRRHPSFNASLHLRG